MILKYIPGILIVLFLLCIASCYVKGPVLATGEEKSYAMRRASFDKAIIGDMSRYDGLKSLLLSCSDTFIAYRNERAYMIEIGEGGITKRVPYIQPCQVYRKDNPETDSNSVPCFLRKKLDSLYDLPDKKIMYVEICRDKKLTIKIREDRLQHGLSISHCLVWNGGKERDYAYIDNRDTMISKNCIYRLGLTENHGH